MTQPQRSFKLLFRLALSVFLLAGSLVAQRTVHPVNRVTAIVDDRFTVPRLGDRHPLARAEYDAGPASPDTPMERMILVLSPDADQQSALDQFLDAQQDPASPDYHRWLTPEEFGSQFGVSEDDLWQIVNWLQGHGFTVEPVSPARRSVVFSGTAAEVASAFHTGIHVYIVNGQRHFANSTAPEIPAALDAVVQGIASLHDFHSKPMLAGVAPLAVVPYRSRPEYSVNSTTHYLAPADFTTIYDVTPLYGSSIDGTGQSIAVAGRSNINLSDVQAFRRTFGLPAKDPTIILNGTNPGIPNQSEQFEATLDVEWSGVAAQGASVQFVVSASTNASDGVDLSVQYIVNHNLAPVVTLSFGSCESAMGTSWNQHWNALWQQAATQGMSAMVASGDAGAAGCDSGSESTATGGQGVNGLCSSPFSTCVGGTQFNDTANPGAYWSPTSASNWKSALSYIPEVAWNQSGAAGGSGLWASGGGASIVYPKPSWQTGSGVPSDGRRDVPDVALNASSHDSQIVDMNGGLYLVSGTSIAAPSFASVVVLAVQKAGVRLGNINPALYTLASKQATGGTAVFHDVTTGNNSVPGVTGYSAGAGYDLATGLGSVDAANMVNHWSDSTGPPVPAFQLSASPASVTVSRGASGTSALSLSVSGGFNAAVALSASGLPAGVTAGFSPATIPAGSTASTLTLNASTQAAAGSTAVTITASGGGVTRTAPVTVVIPACTYSINPTSASPGSSAGTYSVQVTAGTGCSWTAVSTVSWITVTSGASGSGNGTVNYSLAANTATTTRSGAITIAGISLGVTQAAAAPPFSLNMSSANIGAGASTGSVAVSAVSSTASWTAVSNVSWITITSGASGTGSKSVGYSVAANTTTASRTGTMTIAGLTFSVIQPAAPGIALSATPSSVSLTAGSSATSSVSVAGTGGFTGSVTLSVSGLPAGVTAAFNPPSVAPGGASVLTLTAAASTAATTASLTVTGASGSLSAKAAISLTVNANVAAGFTLKAASPSLNLPLGSSASTVVSVAPAGNFTGNVTLAVTGLPCMVQAVFTPSTVKAGGTASLQLTSSNGPLVTTGLTITGSSGSLSATTPLNLTVTAPAGIQLIAKTSFLNLTPGSTASTTITMQATGGFTGTTNLLATAIDPLTGGALRGVTASITPTTIGPGGTATLTLTASASAPVAIGSVGVEGFTPAMALMGATWITLNNAKPGFTLLPVSLPASSQTLTRWLDQSVLINYSGGFSGPIQFTFSGLPNGVIGTFLPVDNCAGSSICDVRFELLAGITATATPLTPITITGTSGSLTASTTFNIAVAPAASLAVGPQFAGYSDSYQLTTPVGGTATATLRGSGKVTGFSVNVTGLPPTATSSIVAAPPSGYLVNIATASQTAPGCYSLNYSGTPTGGQAVPGALPLYLTVTK